MHSYPIAPVRSGRLVVPHEVNAELRDIVGELNGRVDRENFVGNSLPAAKLALSSMGDRYFATSDTAQNIVVTRATKSISYPIPDSAGAPIYKEATDFRDGFVIVSAGLELEATALGLGFQFCIGVQIDGALVARSPLSASLGATSPGIGDRASVYMRCYSPIGSGAHRIQPVVFITREGTVICRGRHFYVRRGWR